MSLYEYILHEYSYALFLANHYDFYLWNSMITNMVSEWYFRNEDDDASASDSKIDEADAFYDAVTRKFSLSRLHPLYGHRKQEIRKKKHWIKVEWDLKPQLLTLSPLHAT